MAGQIQPFDIVAPGRKGLNSEAGSTLLDPSWCTTSLNAVINRQGRLAARKGWADKTTNAIASTPQIAVMHEYLDAAGASIIISCATTAMFKDIDDFTDSNNDISSATAPTNPYWQLVNFNGKVVGFQRGDVGIVKTSGDFADLSFTGTGPDGNACVAAFGRIWGVDADLQTIRYSALLDEADYSTANGGGVLNMANIWTQGMDEIVAVSALGSMFIVFGKNHIIFWADGSGSELGITASRLQVVDTIEGTGCIARDSVRVTGEGDIIFLSRHGVQSLARVIQEKTNPVVSLSKNVRAKMLASIAIQRTADGDFDQVQSCHNPETGLYILNLPADGTMYAFDTHHPFQDDDGALVFPVTQWEVGGSMGALLSVSTGEIYMGSSGVVGHYTGNVDDASPYTFTYESGWLDMGEANHRLKFLKEITATVGVGTANVTYTWAFDFTGSQMTRTHTYTNTSDSEWSVSEYSLGEFSGGVRIQRKVLPAHGEGQFLRLGVTSAISSSDLIVQVLSIAPKLGRAIT